MFEDSQQGNLDQHANDDDRKKKRLVGDCDGDEGEHQRRIACSQCHRKQSMLRVGQTCQTRGAKTNKKDRAKEL